MSATGSVDIVREVSDEEVAKFHENGWAKLDRLVDPAITAEIFAHVQNASSPICSASNKQRASTQDPTTRIFLRSGCTLPATPSGIPAALWRFQR